MNNLKEVYIQSIAEALFKSNSEFFFTYAPVALTQFFHPKEFDDLPEEEKRKYLAAAEMVVPIFAPKVVTEAKDE